MYCNKNQFPELSFSGSHSKSHDTKGMSKHHHLCFDPKLGMRICTICCIPCACVTYTSMLDKSWISGISSDKQELYKPVTKCTYWPVLSAFNNWKII